MITNKTAKKVLVKQSKILDSLLLKAIGLMFSRPIRDFGLIFRFSNEAIRPLHMFFVFYPIDVLFLDKGCKIVEIKHNLKPFWHYAPKKKSQYVIELPKGTASGCRIGDRINFK